MAQLAIKGHITRCKEVIEILEMLGGKNIHNLKGIDDEYYYIDNDGFIDSELDGIENWEEKFTLFTPEEFLEKFPYKVGDKVIYKSEILPIIGMKWRDSNNTVIYTMKSNCDTIDCYDSTWMKPYKEQEPMEETINEMLAPVRKIGSDEILYYVDKNTGDIKENKEIMEIKPTVTFEYIVDAKTGDLKLIVPENMEFILNSNEVILRDKKPKYPKTYEECCKMLNIPNNGYIVYSGNWVYGGDYLEKHLERIRNFQKLLICRDAYWRLARDWKPNWTIREDKFCIIICKDKATIFDGSQCITRPLAFPTEEMRDTFYENFKDLIEECKELL